MPAAPSHRAACGDGRRRYAGHGNPAPQGRGLGEPDLQWLRTTFADSLLRTAALYGVRP